MTSTPNQLTEYLDTTLQWVESTEAADFLSEQTPLFIEEFLFFNQVYLSTVVGLGYTFTFIVAPLITLAMWKHALKIHRRADTGLDFWDRPEAYNLIPVIASCGIGITVLFAFVGATTYTRDLIMVWTAPRVFIVEGLSRLL